MDIEASCGGQGKRIPTVDLCGIGIHNVSMAETVSLISDWVSQGKVGYVVTPNVDHIVRLQNDWRFRRVYDNAALIIPDGMPLIWGAKCLGTPLKQRVTGSDLFIEICARLSRSGTKIFLLGGAPGAAEGAAHELVRRYPGLHIVGTHCPAYGFENDDDELLAIASLVRKTEPDVLFVGLGSPKQEYWISEWQEHCRATIAIGVGVAFSFVAGDVRRAPKLFQRAGLEWLWRLAMEPKRLWRRYLVDDPVFFKLLAQQMIRTRFSSQKR